FLTVLATPSFPGAPTPTGHSTAVPAPTCSSHSGLNKERYEVHTNVVPEPSDLCTTTISFLGSGTSGLSSAILASSHIVISPLKMSASIGPVRCSPFWLKLGMLYATTTDPMASGMCTAGAGSASVLS